MLLWRCSESSQNVEVGSHKPNVRVTSSKVRISLDSIRELEEEKKSPKANGRGKRDSPSEEAEAPAVKKGRGAKKAASKETEVDTANKDQKAESEAQEEDAGKEETSPKTSEQCRH